MRIAIDDFGAGFSSLTRLRHLTVHILKLDRSFLAGVPEDPRGAALIAAMLRLARELDLFVVAEGIETAEQLGYLRVAGAGHGQGFHVARPMPAAELTKKLLRAWAARRAGPAAAARSDRRGTAAAGRPASPS